jgi:ABC-type branched-subunit amino acid transport system permease subunit
VEHQVVARVLLTMLCGIQAIATVVIDFNKTHATNPLWVRHARFHVVWQTVSMALVGGVEVWLVWGNVIGSEKGFYLAMILAGISPVAFLFSCLGRSWYGGALSDPNGIPPVRINLFGRGVSVDMNLAAVVAALVSMAVFVAIYRW